MTTDERAELAALRAVVAGYRESLADSSGRAVMDRMDRLTRHRLVLREALTTLAGWLFEPHLRGIALEALEATRDL